jgi:hypothetical protein
MINERLGVPDNIEEVAYFLYKNIIKNIEKDYKYDDIANLKISINKDFKIGKLNFNEFNIEFELYDYNNLEIVGFSVKKISKLDLKTFTFENVKSPFKMSIKIATPKTLTGDELKRFFIKNRLEIISSISHELKHYYDHGVNKRESVIKRANYETSLRGFANIKALCDFSYYLYYTSNIENLVRPSEISAEIKYGRIKKSNFYNFITNDKSYKSLSSISKYTFDELYNELKKEIDVIKDFFDKIGVKYDGMSDDDILNRVLRLYYDNVRNWKADSIEKILTTNIVDQMFGLRGDKEVFFNKMLNKISKYGDNYKKFFIFEIKSMNMVANKMMKKISKLYDLAKSSKNESILNWDLYMKLTGRDRLDKISIKPSKYFNK